MLGLKKAYCLCLDKREEHWLDLKKQCESKGLEFNRFLVGKGEIFPKEEYDLIDGPAPDNLYEMWNYGGHTKDSSEEVLEKKTHHYNALLSHQAMAKKALEDGEERVLFLEDDSYFTERFDEVIKKLEEKEVENADYDMLYLAWWIGDDGDEFNEDVEKIWREEKSVAIGRANRIGGLHGVIISRKILDIITRLDTFDPVDSQLTKFFHDKIKSYFVAPKIIHDKGIFSECEQNVVTRTKL